VVERTWATTNYHANFGRAVEEGKSFNKHIPTVEFRRHEATLDSRRVVEWIQTIVGIIDFVDTADQDYLMKLFLKVGEEKWQKEGYPKGAFQQDKFGPIPAEGSLTVVDLLKYMHLNEQADFYSSRLNAVVGKEPHYRPTVYEWEYEKDHSHGRLTDEGYHKQHELRLLWEKSLTAALALLKGSSYKFDPNDPMWPKHVRVNKWPPLDERALWDAAEENKLREELEELCMEDDEEGHRLDDEHK
jgi:hypothetical protein